MNILKPAYMLELEVGASSAPLTDAHAVFRAHSTTLWNYTNAVTETADKKQAQAYWCRVNKKKLVAGLSSLDASDGTAKRFLANKKPKVALSGNYMHFVYVTGAAKLRLYCVWQFIDDEALAVAMETQAVAEAAVADAEETIRMLREQLERVEGEAAAPVAAPMLEEPTVACLCTPAIMQIETRLSALEGVNSYALQLGMMLGLMLGLSSANASAEEALPTDEAESASDEESADEADADADADADSLVIDTKRITDPFGANPAKVGDIITCNIKGAQYFVEIKSVNASGITFKLLKQTGRNTFRYSNRTPPAQGNLNYARRLYRVTNGQLQLQSA